MIEDFEANISGKVKRERDTDFADMEDLGRPHGPEACKDSCDFDDAR